jgi:hypothetical protein
MQRLASIADKYAVIRSIRHDQGNHGAGNHYMMTGAPPRIPVGCGAFVSFHPSLGSGGAREAGAPPGLPAYFSMPDVALRRAELPGREVRPVRRVRTNPNDSKNFRVRDVAIPARLTRTASRAGRICGKGRSPGADQRRGGRRPRAPSTSSTSRATSSSPRRRPSRRSTSPRAGQGPRALRPHGFGQRALLARRLVEAGVPFITLYDGGWDHTRGDLRRLNKRLPAWDNTVATLIEDLDERGMLDSTMVIAWASSAARRRSTRTPAATTGPTP